MAILRAAALVAALGTLADASTDIPAQLYGNTAYSQPTTPSELPTALSDLVNTVSNLTSFSYNLQRALLWSAGWVRANPDTAGSSSAFDDVSSDYVQVYVLCGRTMADVFQSASAFDNDTACPILNCKSNVITYTEASCDVDFAAEKALCALSSGITVTPVARRAPVVPGRTDRRRQLRPADLPVRRQHEQHDAVHVGPEELVEHDRRLVP